MQKSRINPVKSKKVGFIYYFTLNYSLIKKNCSLQKYLFYLTKITSTNCNLVDIYTLADCNENRNDIFEMYS